MRSEFAQQHKPLYKIRVFEPLIHGHCCRHSRKAPDITSTGIQRARIANRARSAAYTAEGRKVRAQISILKQTCAYFRFARRLEGFTIQLLNALHAGTADFFAIKTVISRANICKRVDAFGAIVHPGEPACFEISTLLAKGTELCRGFSAETLLFVLTAC